MSILTKFLDWVYGTTPSKPETNKVSTVVKTATPVSKAKKPTAKKTTNRKKSAPKTKR